MQTEYIFSGMPSPNQTHNATRRLVYYRDIYSNVRRQCDLRGFSYSGSFVMLSAWCQVYMLILLIESDSIKFENTGTRGVISIMIFM